MRMAVALAASVRTQRPDLPICLYGLYAGMSRDSSSAGIADRVIVGEYEPALLAWANGTGGANATGGASDMVVHLGRSGFTTPARDLLPPLERYARLVLGDEERLAGAVEASHGCSHRCRHCPLPVVYDGRLRVVPEEVVVSDVSQLVAVGARHVTFADPDFLNGPRHAVRVAQAVHSCFPDLSFDCTTKVEHILAHADLWAGMAKAGCLFVVSAFESVDDTTLRILDKGHTAADESAAVTLLRGHGSRSGPHGCLLRRGRRRPRSAPCSTSSSHMISWGTSTRFNTRSGSCSRGLPAAFGPGGQGAARALRRRPS